MAAQALQTMNRRSLLDKEMKVNWAVEPGQQQPRIDTSKHFHVFVGDLSPEVDNKALKEAFIPFGEVSDAKVIRDATTLKSKGYGFVSYPKREEAERAIEQMNGQWLGRRTIRTNWATRKPGQTENEKSYDDVYNSTSSDNTSVYVGNISTNCTEDHIREAFGKYGRIQEVKVVRIFKVQGYAFVKFETKDQATKAILQMNGQEVAGNNVRCSWGKTQDLQAAKAAGAGPGAYGYGYAQGYGIGSGGSGSGAAAANTPYGSYQSGSTGPNAAAASAAAHQSYWQYYQQYYSNPQMMQQWANYWQQAQSGGGSSSANASSNGSTK
ncbi:hypothetical protein WR25_04500 isoform E [Diploscapter pachys]|uniref:RRM domain-containing protein n=1 Tax=Diploscapter pachys TaxID=2018661 RepID=A0A2A2LFZ6_9BILA|nr:hypothetical protein WR25_04500 isoform A [Diploscapter pachys]PAV85070.1 hypothetical protein WR25_04500 isoform B [Diploscapter pachys]PAV85071.1 hypothetical protein WR25_04500 isoform C [Diploscapter pachys]PAV85072.1 hypothetical protein WR25_04500 isoform D [Diploscapter pachys]PAV85073.1 hypothetical protein WR25_04500 isoform E [Diploscapter pachys]